MRIGLGQPGSAATPAEIAACGGSNPCTDWDWWFVSDACANFLSCAGQPPVTFGSVLQQGTQNLAADISGAASGVISGAASGLGQGVAANLTASGFVASALAIGAVALVVFGVIEIEK